MTAAEKARELLEYAERAGGNQAIRAQLAAAWATLALAEAIADKGEER